MEMFPCKGETKLCIYAYALASTDRLTDASCLRNVVAMFHVLEKEMEWRKSTGRVEGFETMKKSKPIVAVGPEHSLEDECLMADYFRESPIHRV